jgi:hypothetical protein
MRTTEEIKAEIAKVNKANDEAIKKQTRCYKRIRELHKELQEAEQCQK